jgi:hypothetical protein
MKMLIVFLPFILIGEAEMQYEEPIGPSPMYDSCNIGECQSKDDDARVYPEEIIMPSIDSSSDNWKPLYQEYENPETISCDKRLECESVKADAIQTKEVEAEDK